MRKVHPWKFEVHLTARGHTNLSINLGLTWRPEALRQGFTSRKTFDRKKMLLQGVKSTYSSKATNGFLDMHSFLLRRRDTGCEIQVIRSNLRSCLGSAHDWRSKGSGVRITPGEPTLL